jgi:hypothetical protein
MIAYELVRFRTRDAGEIDRNTTFRSLVEVGLGAAFAARVLRLGPRRARR